MTGMLPVSKRSQPPRTSRLSNAAPSKSAAASSSASGSARRARARCHATIASAAMGPTQGRSFAAPSTPASQAAWNRRTLASTVQSGMERLRFPLATPEQGVADPPFLAGPVPEQLGAGHEEDAPPLQPGFRRLRAIRGGQRLQRRPAVYVEIPEPGIGRLLIMGAIPPPAADEPQIVLEACREVVGRHHPAGEKVPAHPVRRPLLLEGVRRASVAEHVHEEQAARREPVVDAGEQFAPVAHVLEHLNRDDAVEALLRLETVQ